MKRPDIRHYTEEELLLHVLDEEEHEAGQAVEAHLKQCAECAAVYQEYKQVAADILQWVVPELPLESWSQQKGELLHRYREEGPQARGKGIWEFLERGVGRVWNYALANPLPALGYIIAAVAFASERSISVFRLDKVLPATTEVFKIIRQVL